MLRDSNRCNTFQPGLLTRKHSAWEQRKLGEIAFRRNEFSSDGDLPQVEYEDVVSGQGVLNKDVAAKGTHKPGLLFDQGDILYGKLRPYLNNWLLPAFSGIAVGDWWVLQSEELDSSYLYRLIQSDAFQRVANVSAGSKMPRADWKLVGESYFPISPSLPEQRAIGTLFARLDSLITLHQRQAEPPGTHANMFSVHQHGRPRYPKGRPWKLA